MALTPSERRFIQYWEEQRKGSKSGYVAMYSLAYFIALFMSGVVFGLFTGFRMLTWNILIGLAIISVVGAVIFAIFQRKRNERKFHRILRRELEETHLN